MIALETVDAVFGVLSDLLSSLVVLNLHFVGHSELLVMQSFEDTEPVVRIRDLKKDRVNFVLDNVDLAYVHSPVST